MGRLYGADLSNAAWRRSGIWTRLQWSLHATARQAAGHRSCPTVAIMDGQSVKTTERSGVRGFDAHKRTKGRERHILVDLVGGRHFALPDLRTLVADAGHESRELARALKEQEGDTLQIVQRRGRAFEITGLTWIVERSIAWLNRNRRLAKDHQFRVQSSGTTIHIAAIRPMLNRLAPA